MIVPSQVAREMQRVAYAQPLTQARGATEAYFRQLHSAAVSVGLTVNK